MNLSPIQQELSKREVYRKVTPNSESITYDTDQTIERTLLNVSTSEQLRNLTGIEELPYVSTSIYNQKSGERRVQQNPPSTFMLSRDLSTEPTGYPELKPLLNRLLPFNNKRLSFTAEPWITLLMCVIGNRYVPPLICLFNPVIIIPTLISCLFPFRIESKFDLKKASKAFQKEGTLVKQEEVLAGSDQYLACIRSSWLHENSNRHSDSLRVTVFNPKLFNEQIRDHKVSNRFNSIFKLSVYESQRADTDDKPVPIINLFSVDPYHNNSNHRLECTTLEKIESERGKYGFYIKVHKKFIEALEGIAPLPVEESDCGANLGYPKHNEKFLAQERFASERTLILDTIKENAADLIAKIKDNQNWISQQQAKQVSENYFLTRPVIEKDLDQQNQQSFNLVQEYLPIPNHQLDQARALSEIPDHELQYFGILKEQTHKLAVINMQ